MGGTPDMDNRAQNVSQPRATVTPNQPESQMPLPPYSTQTSFPHMPTPGAPNQQFGYPTPHMQMPGYGYPNHPYFPTPYAPPPYAPPPYGQFPPPWQQVAQSPRF